LKSAMLISSGTVSPSDNCLPAGTRFLQLSVLTALIMPMLVHWMSYAWLMSMGPKRATRHSTVGLLRSEGSIESARYLAPAVTWIVGRVWPSLPAESTTAIV
jgi:hypothetical protein